MINMGMNMTMNMGMNMMITIIITITTNKTKKVTRHDAGVYVCNAENGVGKPASAQISLQVLCKLMIMMMTMIVMIRMTRW